MNEQEMKDIVEITKTYRDSADEARRNRMDLNQINFDAYHLRQDYSHKKSGQSREFLAKQQMAVEQLSSFIAQGLVDINQWFSVETAPGADVKLLTPREVEGIIQCQVDKIGMLSFTEDAMKLGLLGSVMICKVGGKFSSKPKFYTETKLENEVPRKVLKREEKKVWNVDWSLVRQQDYYPDPTGRGLYELQNIYMDKHEVEELTKGEDAIYSKEVFDLIGSSGDNDDQIQKEYRSRETGQNTDTGSDRLVVKITEGWGTLVDKTGKVIMANCTWSVANDRWLISKPKPNPWWHGMSPFVVTPIVRVPHSVWHRALMDAATRHNIAINELYNLIIDGGMMSTFGIKQLRPDWLEDTNQVSDGIFPGITLEASSKCPPGAKVLERIDTSSLSSESLNVFSMINGEFQQSSLTNDLRMGILPARAVKATEVVEASQSITSVLTGTAKKIEQDFIQRLLNMTWMNTAQHFDKLDFDEIGAIITPNKAMELFALGPEEIFADTAMGLKYKVFGVSRTLNKVKDFRKLTSLLQTIGSSEVLIEEFIKKYSFEKFLGEIMDSLDINTDKIKHDEVDQMLNMMGNAGGMPPVQGMPDMQSNIPQAAAGSINETVESRIPRADFPASRATPAGMGL